MSFAKCGGDLLCIGVVLCSCDGWRAWLVVKQLGYFSTQFLKVPSLSFLFSSRGATQDVFTFLARRWLKAQW